MLTLRIAVSLKREIVGKKENGNNKKKRENCEEKKGEK